MSYFKLEVNLIGGHGVDRSKAQGEFVNFDESSDTFADSIIARHVKALVHELKRNQIQVVGAVLVHDTSIQVDTVVDDLITGIRIQNDFLEKVETKPEPVAEAAPAVDMLSAFEKAISEAILTVETDKVLGQPPVEETKPAEDQVV